MEELAVPVTGGLFTVPDLDFGSAAFAGEARWLQVEVRCPPDGTYTVVGDRQALTATPYALYPVGNWAWPATPAQNRARTSWAPPTTGRWSSKSTASGRCASSRTPPPPT